MTKKVYKQKYFSLITKNWNWEILTENLVTFRREDGVKDENFDILGVHWKIWLWGGVGGELVHEKRI